MTLDPRHADQVAVVENYFRVGAYRTTLVLSTGFGKSKIGIDILKHKQPKKIIILVNSTLLRDTNWEVEFKKFNAMDLFARTELHTYQAAYRWKKEDVDLTDTFVLADEVDFAADTPELSKFFYEFSDVEILALTGFITDGKKEWFAKHLPVLQTLSAADAQKKNILNKIHYIYVKYDISTNSNDVVVEYVKSGKKKSFTQSENNAYDYANKKVQMLSVEQSTVQADFLKGDISHEEYTSKLKSIEYKMRMATNARTDVLLHSKSSSRIAKKLVEHILAEPENKVIVFSKRVKQSGAICGNNVYNGSVTPKKAAENFQNFQTGEIRALGVCDKVNRGANINGLNNAILETYFGSDTQAVQKFGRLMRLHPDAIATVYVLLPYYMRKEKDNKFTLQETQQVSWARNMLRSTDINSSTIWDYRVVKEQK